MKGRGKGCRKQGVSAASPDLPAGQEMGFPATLGLSPVLQLAGTNLSR